EDMIQGGILDLQLLREKTLALLKHEQQRKAEDQSVQHLRRVVERLRHQIATNEPLATDEPSNLQVATLWGAKGVTAEHVYILGVMGLLPTAVPGDSWGGCVPE